MPGVKGKRNVTQLQPKVLGYVMEHQSMTLSDMARDLEMTNKNAYDWMRYLSRKRLVQKERNVWTLSVFGEQMVMECCDRGEIRKIGNSRLQTIIWVGVAVRSLYLISKKEKSDGSKWPGIDPSV